MKAEDLTAMLDAIVVLKERLPYLITLLPDEKREMLKMGDTTFAFVTKALEYAVANPNLVGFIDLTEFDKDVKLINSLLKVLRPLQQIVEQLEDTVMQAGSEAYNEALHFYGTSRVAMKSVRERRQYLMISLKDSLAKQRELLPQKRKTPRCNLPQWFREKRYLITSNRNHFLFK